MARTNHSEQEWETFLALTDRLGIEFRGRLDQDVRFTTLESAGHRLGRTVAQMTTERWSLARGRAAHRAAELSGMAVAPDPDVWDYATKQGFVIVSKDTDFQLRAVLLGYRGIGCFFASGS